MDIEPGSLVVVHHERSLSRMAGLLCILAFEDLHASLVSILFGYNLLYHRLLFVICFSARLWSLK
jgi:hypothetical protein